MLKLYVGLLQLTILLSISFFPLEETIAACTNTRTWQADAGTTTWLTNNNWIPRNFPSSSNETAFIRSDWRIPLFPERNMTLSCLEINSGSMTAPTGSRTLNIRGDYFKNLNPGSLTLPSGSNFRVRMNGTADQTFENVDPIPRLRISNANRVTLTHSFVIQNQFLISAGSGNIDIQGGLETLLTGTITIPDSATVTVSSGVEWKLAGNLTVNGVLKLESGAKLILANNRTLSIGTNGTLQLNGTSGNAVIVDSTDSSSTFNFNVLGTIDAEYFSINHMKTAGLNITGTVLDLSNGDIHYIPTNGYGITLGAAASLPTTLTGNGFFDEGAAGTQRAVNATSYNLAAITFNDWAGIAGTPNETDPNGKIDWGGEATPKLQISNSSPGGTPPTSIAKGSAYTHFATFSFSMSGTAATATNITSLKFTIDGVNNNSDITGLKVYKDADNNCVYNDGIDAQIGGIYTTSGTPSAFTVPFSIGDIQIIDTTTSCVHVQLSTSSSAQTANTVGIKVTSSDDIVNDQSYELSATSSPPVSAGTSSISGSSVAKWNGGYGTNMGTANNWTPSGVPNSTNDCEIGNGYSVPLMNTTRSCLNTNFISGGSINFNNSSSVFQVYGSFTSSSSFSYLNATNAILRSLGTTNQSINLNNSTFPGNFEANNSSATTKVESSGTISGNLSINNGTFSIENGVDLTVSGNITVASGATLKIQPGGTLTLGNSQTITINSGATLDIVGSSGSGTTIKAINNSSSYTVAINGTIKAKYYTFENLGLTGLTINSGATIDSTDHLQNGTFSYPGVNSSNMLRLFRKVPTDTLDTMAFQSSGSTATSVISVFTNTTSGTLTISNYSGDLTGVTYTNDTNYNVSWGTETTTIKITSESTAPATVNQGDIVNIGRFGFEQSQAGTFNDTNITYVRLTLTGNGSSSDIDNVRLYYDSGCTGSGGTLLGTQSFSGNPARATFTSITGVIIPSDIVSPAKRCLYVEYDVNSLATNGKTVGVKIEANSDVVNSETYAFDASFAPPVSLSTSTIIGSTTYWTGATDTDWFNTANWDGGLPTSALNCQINNVANDPVIASGTATCKSVSIGSGILTMTGGQLEVYGAFENTGTFTQGGNALVLRDNGVVASTQNLSTTSLSNLQFNKTAGGSVNLTSSTLTMTSPLSFGAGNNFTFYVQNGKTLQANNGITISSGILEAQTSSNVKIASGQTLLVDGGTLKTSGVNDGFPQSLSNKAKFDNTGSGTWTFSATSGTIDLTGFIFESLDTNGLNFSGTTNITQINGGQLRSLPNNSGMQAIQFNNSGSLPTTIGNFGWNWADDNAVPATATPYSLASSTGCGSRTVTFDQWFGDFWPFGDGTLTTDKISTTSCTVIIDPAASPVSLTKFTAAAYNSEVLLEWITGSEWSHSGFNVYRSLSPEEGFTQINQNLIQNDMFSTTIHGSYAFIDQSVDNDITYYYKIEDISTTGARTLHGPLAATPKASLGAAPTPNAGTIVSDNDDDSTVVTGPNTQKVLAPGVYLLSETNNFMRIKITIPDPTFTDNTEFNQYKHANIPLYSSTTTEGSPELPSRTLMIKIGDAQSASFELISELYKSYTSLFIAPTPKWILDSGGNNYIKQWYENSSVYSQNASSPSSPILLGNIVNNNGKLYLPVTILPMDYNPIQKKSTKYDELVIDISLNGKQDWNNNQPIANNDPWGFEGGLKIGYDKSGVYKITYDELEIKGFNGPFANVDISELKIFIADQEVPIQVNSADNTFNNGDSIVFFAPHFESNQSRNNHVLLVTDSGGTAGLRMTNLDGSVSANPNVKDGFLTHQKFEENNVALFNEPYSQDMDHFVWKLIYGVSGGGASVDFTADVELPSLISSSSNDLVTVLALVKSRTTNVSGANHNLQIFINELQVDNTSNQIGNISFTDNEPHLTVFKIPADYFVAGTNKITIKATGNNLQSGEYDMVYIDNLDITYKHAWSADNDKLIIDNAFSYNRLSIDGFTTGDIKIYDITNFKEPSYVNQTTISNSSGNYSVEYTPIVNNDSGYRYWASLENQLLTAKTFSFINGSDLRNTNNEADVIYLGSNGLLDAITDLAEYRRSEGYNYQLITLESIYNEFGKGIHNAEAIKAFIQYTQTQWSIKPKYVVLLGDGTYDPKSYQNNYLEHNFPIKFLSGQAWDYASDNWYASFNNGDLPDLVIARIPGRTYIDVVNYGQKVIDYENGISKPTSSAMTLIADKAQNQGENFDLPLDKLSTDMKLWNQKTNISSIKRSSSATDAEVSQDIINAFDNSALIHYMGHGAEDLWGDDEVFNSEKLSQMTNQKLPIVVAMSCLNGYFYDPDLEGLGEQMVMKADGGAIAFWGSASLTNPSLQDIYQRSFYETLLQNKDIRLGDAIKMAKWQASSGSPASEIINSWTLLGDPLVKPAMAYPAAAKPVDSVPVENRAPAAVVDNAAGGCSANASINSSSNSSSGSSSSNTLWILELFFLLATFLVWFLLKTTTKKVLIPIRRKNTRNFSRKD